MCKFLDKKKKKTLTEMTENTEAARLIRKRITKRRKMMEKSLTSVGYRNERNFSLYTPSPLLSTLLFLRTTAYVVSSFVKNRTRVASLEV